MIKFYKIFLLILTLIFLSTYNPLELNSNIKENNSLFKIKNIIIEKTYLVDEIVLKKKLNKLYKKNILLIKKKNIKESLNQVDFLEKIEVQKKYPNTIIIKVYETKPIAVFFKEEKKYIIDNLSNLILYKKDINYGKLPTIFGKDADTFFLNFYKKLTNNDFPKQLIKNYYYFQIGRWDLQLINNQVIKFPDKKIDNTITKSIELLDREDFKNYKIIDLRVDGKIIVE